MNTYIETQNQNTNQKTYNNIETTKQYRINTNPQQNNLQKFQTKTEPHKNIQNQQQIYKQQQQQNIQHQQQQIYKQYQQKNIQHQLVSILKRKIY